MMLLLNIISYLKSYKYYRDRERLLKHPSPLNLPWWARWEVRGLRNSPKFSCRWPEDWSRLTGTCPSMMTYIRGPQSSDCRLVPVHGLLRTGPHSGRWAVGEQVKSPSLVLPPEPSHPPPPPLCQNSSSTKHVGDHCPTWWVSICVCALVGHQFHIKFRVPVLKQEKSDLVVQGFYLHK